MGHECPECGVGCHCGGDIDDLIIGEPTNGCSHCDDQMDIDDDEDELGPPDYFGCNACGTVAARKPPYNECQNFGAPMEEQWW